MRWLLATVAVFLLWHGIYAAANCWQLFREKRRASHWKPRDDSDLNVIINEILEMENS